MNLKIEDRKLTFMPIRYMVDMLVDNKEQFVVPDYQRGYRWQPKQVEQLLNDLWFFAYEHEFALKRDFESPYCLQPVVVAKREDGNWEIIDGQQRLTTISLILKYIGEDSFSIIYDTRNEAANNLENFCQNEASKTIEKWFKTPKGLYKEKDLIKKFYTILLEPELYLAHFIWYNVTDEVRQDDKLAIDIFDRLNIGKIGLTNAELIKALFMTFIDSNTQSERHKNLTQITLGTEWDTIERTMQQPLFWHFVCQQPELYVTHIEYIFDILMSKTEDKEEKYTFNQYVRMLKEEGKSIEELWAQVKNLFQLFEDRYNDSEAFHYVGYLISSGQPISGILEWRYNYNKRNGERQLIQKDDFKRLLYEKCKETMKNIDLDDPDFFNTHKNKNTIRLVLLLFNVFTITKSVDKKQYFMRFPFDEYRKKDEKGNCIWDIEHIHSQSDKVVDETWIKTMLTYFTGETDEEKYEKNIDELKNDDEILYCRQLLKLLQRKKKKENIDLELAEIYKTLKTKYESDEKFDEYKHSLGNLTLLDKWTNRSYQHAFFPVKRSIIIRNARQGNFVPLCTQNVFLKAYTKHLGSLAEWNDLDCKDYLEEIKRTIK